MTDSPRRAVCFDLDGTLVDSLPDITSSFAAALVEHGLPAPSQERMRELIGLPLEVMYATVAPQALVPELVAGYRRIYPQRFTENSAPFAEAPEVLAALRDRGYLLAVTTTKRTDMAVALIEAVGLTDALDHVQGTDGFPAKPAPEVVLRALAALEAEGSWMVGDTSHDIGAGKAAGLATYAVSRPGSTHDRPTLLAAEPDRLETSLLPLLDAVGTE